MAAKTSGIGTTTDAKNKNEVPVVPSKKTCQPCAITKEKRAAHVFCSSCNEFQCLECSNRHSIYSYMENHKLVDVNAPPGQLFSHDIGGLDRCEKHYKTVKFFCKDDNKLCCSTCAILEHKNCSSMEEIKNIKLNDDKGDAAIQLALRNMLEKCSATAKHWTDSERHLETKLHGLKEHLLGIKAFVMKKLDDFEEDILQQAASITELKKAEYSRNHSNTEESISLLESRLDMINATERYGTPEQLFILRQRATAFLVHLDGKTSEELSKLENADISLELSHTLERLLGSNEKLGSLKTSTTKVRIDSIVDGIPVKLKTIMSIDVKQSSDDRKKPFYTGMDFLPDGRLVVVDNFNKKCITLDDKLEKLGSFIFSESPFGVATTSDDKIAVTTASKTIYFLLISKSNEITQEKSFSTRSKYYSISVKDNNHFVVSSYDDTKPVRIVSFCGEEQDLNIDFPEKKYILGGSGCTYIKSSDKIVVSDRYEDTVYIYDVHTNKRIVVKDDRIKEPIDVAIGPFGTIFVCSNRRHSVIQISPTGKIMSVQKLDMKCPRTLCVSNDKTKIAVSGNAKGQEKLQLFSIDI